MKNKVLRIKTCRVGLRFFFNRILKLGEVGDHILVQGSKLEIVKSYLHDGRCVKTMAWIPYQEPMTCFSTLIQYIEVPSISGPKLFPAKKASLHDFRYLYDRRLEVMQMFVVFYDDKAHRNEIIAEKLTIQAKKLEKKLERKKKR
jgi:hypothetical protein